MGLIPYIQTKPQTTTKGGDKVIEEVLDTAATGHESGNGKNR